ncbi:g4512 [Coccomyxa elongata]
MGRGGSTGLQGADLASAVSRLPDDTRATLLHYGKTVLHITCSYAVHLSVVVLALYLRFDAVVLQCATLLLGYFICSLLRPTLKPTYLLDFYCLRPPDRMEMSRAEMIAGARRPDHGCSTLLVEFSEKVLEIAGIGDRTYVPESVIRAAKEGNLQQTMAHARDETETALIVCIDKVLKRTGLTPSEVDGLIVNCSAFNPTPSLSAKMVNHFKFKQSIRAFNLSGMGCAASVIAMDMARDMLAVHPNMRILVAGTENITWNIYRGNQRSMLITNCIFRLGAVAYMLSNHAADRRHAKYRLQHVVRTHLGASDEAYNAVIQREDDDGIIGVKIGKELMKVAGQALTANIMQLAPLVLPVSEQLIFAGNFVARKVLGINMKPYTPDFKTAFDHFCIHPGGKAVISEVGSKLQLNEEQCMPMLVPFERYGNTSSSSTWYAWSYVETFQGVKRGDRLWQLSFGSGFKCASAVWISLRKNNEKHDAWTDTPSWE